LAPESREPGSRLTVQGVAWRGLYYVSSKSAGRPRFGNTLRSYAKIPVMKISREDVLRVAELA
jgi:hypothetical protein